MNDVDSILAGARTFLVVDWPTRDVPNSLALAGYEVVVHGGPGPEDYTAYEVVDGEVVERRAGRPPERADVVYTYRPLDELPEIVETAVGLGAGTVWVHAGDDTARSVVEGAGLAYVDHPDIAGAVRSRLNEGPAPTPPGPRTS
jgi:predicted CoA-binding protein